jgi:hypothetical protein
MHLQKLASGLLDEQALKAARGMIDELERQKAALHPE